LLADAKKHGADTLVTLGGLQSNHARQTAAVAAKFGLGCELVLEDIAGTPKKDYYHNGNVLLNNLLGANIHLLNAGQDGDAYVQTLIEKLSNDGKKPYLIPVGGSNVVGSYGYIRCANEILQQLEAQEIQPDQIVLASGSAGTQAGLLAGMIAAETDIPVLGICVSRTTQEQQALVTSLLQKILLNIGLDPNLAQGKVICNGNYVGDGYGIPTAAMVSAVKRCAQLEGLLLDPVYTGKAMAGLMDLCDQGVIAAGSNQLFLHTGGSPALFAYGEIFKPAILDGSYSTRLHS
ncbi:MAG TPA: D-cysteine desulfhydrase family protein, partial [Oceanospirillales bacterium]|nr:D-cysteine desulfhydrase family protein [Oceanospirillales bacterium]